MSLHISLRNLKDRSSLDEMINELKHKDSKIICGTLFVHVLVVCDIKSLNLSVAFRHHMNDEREVHGLKPVSHWLVIKFNAMITTST